MKKIDLKSHKKLVVSIMLLLSFSVILYIYILFFHSRYPVTFRSPAAVEVIGETIFITVNYTRTGNVPSMVHSVFERVEDGLLVSIAPYPMAGGRQGKNLTASVSIGLPCLPPGDWIRRVRTGYDIFGNGYIWRWAEYYTDPFIISPELSKILCR